MKRAVLACSVVEAHCELISHLHPKISRLCLTVHVPTAEAQRRRGVGANRAEMSDVAIINRCNSQR